MRWDNLQILLAISREGSLTRAAQFLKLDQSTAGRRLSQLEAELGVVLFVRSKAGFAPTQAGEAAILRAKEVESSVNAMADEVVSKVHSAVGTVRLVGNAWTLARLIQTTGSAFLEQNPRMDLRVNTLLRNSHVRGEATVSLWFEKNPQMGEFTIDLGKVPYAVYKSIDEKPDAKGWVMFYDEDACRPVIDSLAQKLQGSDEPLRLTSTDAMVLKQAIASGVGRGLLPMCLAAEDARLVRVSSGAPELERTLWMHTHPDTLETKRIQATIDWLRDSFEPAFRACR